MSEDKDFKTQVMEQICGMQKAFQEVFEAAPNHDPRPSGCSCHPDDRPPECQREHGTTHCQLAWSRKELTRLRKENEILRGAFGNARDLIEACRERFAAVDQVSLRVGNEDIAEECAKFLDCQVSADLPEVVRLREALKPFAEQPLSTEGDFHRTRPFSLKKHDDNIILARRLLEADDR